MKARQYAEALHLAAAHKDEAGMEQILERFRALLTERGHLRLLPAILRELEKLHVQREDPDTVHVHVATDADAQRYAEAIAKDVEALRASGHKHNLLVDDTLVGGYEVRTGGARIDRTYKRALLTLYNTLRTNA
jgi:F0F1-type ATP synthase delta subunit